MSAERKPVPLMSDGEFAGLLETLSRRDLVFMIRVMRYRAPGDTEFALKLAEAIRAVQAVADEGVMYEEVMCGHPVPRGAWDMGYRTCRGCLSDQSAEALALFDIAAAGVTS